MKNKTLWIVFLVLLLIYLGTRFFSSSGSSNFNAELISMDTSAVTRIVLPGKKGAEEELELTKSEKGWIATRGPLSVPARQASVNGLLGQLEEVKARQIVANSSDKWPEYELSDSSATLVEVYSGDDLLERFYLGRFSFNQSTRSGTSYLRLDENPEVYATEGFMAMTFRQGFDSFRDKVVTDFEKEVINRVSVTREGEQLMITKSESGEWKISGENTLDSTAVANFLSGLSNLRGSDFRDDFEPGSSRVSKIGEIEVGLEGQQEPVNIQCYYDSLATDPFVLNSSMNHQAWFSSDSSGIYAKLFPAWTQLLSRHGG